MRFTTALITNTSTDIFLKPWFDFLLLVLKLRIEAQDDYYGFYASGITIISFCAHYLIINRHPLSTVRFVRISLSPRCLPLTS